MTDISTCDSRRPNFCVFMAAFAAIAIAAFGCNDFGSGNPSEGDDGNGGDGDSATVSFASNVLPIFQNNCAGSSCHLPCGPPNGGGLCLASHTSLMSNNVVIVGDADSSKIIKVLEWRPGAGTPMPYGALVPLSDSLIEVIRTWIDEGAQDN